jgi:hypothetical protein
MKLVGKYQKFWRKSMKNKRNWLGILVMVLVFGILTGCGEIENSSGGYSFEFKVEKSSGGIGTPITKIEFINGSSKNDPVLATETVHIGFGEMSSVYKVSGFNNKNGDDYRIFGINLTFENGGTYFKYGSATNKSKIHAWTNGQNVLMLYDGTW